MADITISVTFSDVFKLVRRRTALATETDPFYSKMATEQRQYSQLQGEGDRITSDFVNEAANEVLRCYVSRQGDAAGTPFTNDGTTISYVFAEGSPAISQSDAVQARLQKNTLDCIVYFVMSKLYKTDGNQVKMVEMNTKCLELINEITGDLYRLHD